MIKRRRAGTAPPLPLRRWPALVGLVVLAALWLLSACEQAPYLERILQQGTLRVATREAPGVYFPGADGHAGLEYELVSRFAAELGFEAVKFVVPDSLDALLDMTSRGEVHFAAANLTVTAQRAKFLDFSLPYHSIQEKLVYRRGTRRPRSLADIAPGTLYVLAGSSHEEHLLRLRATQYPELHWTSVGKARSSTLLERLNRGEIGSTIVDSNELDLQQRYFRFVKAAFDVGEEQQLAWAFPKLGDGTLLHEANAFLQRMREDGSLELLLERYYGHSGRLNFVDKRNFWRHVAERLPRYRAHFAEAARVTGIDWRLLAAIGYQESHWRPNAVSPTGVRGIMMLTRDTARQMKIKDRRDPRESILGGARYVRRLEKKLPERIAEPDKLWLTLAAYNVGFGHLEDARILTERQGGSPDLWKDVKTRLPMLTRKKYYATLKHGRARGHEPVHYVENIRNYYDLLLWADNRERAAAGTGNPGSAH